MAVKVGVIGLGFMGSAHARVYSKLKDCELVGVCDCNHEKRLLAKDYKCKFFDSVEGLLSESLDAVSVCTPTSLHKPVVLEALEIGKHVLVEKPFADSVKNGLEMANKAAKAGCVLAVGYIERFNSAVEQLKETVDFSQIFSTVSTRFGPFPPRTKYSGVFLDLASHEIDLLNYLTKARPKVLYAHFSSKTGNNFEDYAYISLKHGHIHSHIEVSWLPNYKLRLIHIYGNRRFYTLNYAQQKLTVYRAPPEAKIVHGSWKDILWLSRHVEEDIPVSSSEPLVEELQRFIDSVKTGEVMEPLCKPEEAIQVLEVAETAFDKSGFAKKVDAD